MADQADTSVGDCKYKRTAVELPTASRRWPTVVV